MAGTAVFQSGALATPGAGIVIHTDNVNGTVVQIVKFDVGPAGTTLPLHYALGTGLPVAGIGTFQALGTMQPLAGSVHVANTIPGTVQVIGTTQPLAGSVHLASALPGTVQALGTVQPLAGSVHVANTLPGTIQVLGSVQTVGTAQVLGTTQPLAGSVHVANTLPGTVQVLGSVQAVGTTQILGTATLQANNGGLTDRSGTIAASGVAQPAATTNTARTYLFFQNVSAGDLWVSVTAAAVPGSTSMYLPAGASYENPPHFCPTGTVSVWGTTVGQAYTCKEA